ncbi:MAG: hypothetical protein LBH44_12565 [Treponema sp.]|nr:hypothetical protein [Treponema sp.]
MKTIRKLFCVIVLAAVFLMTACDDTGNDAGNIDHIDDNNVPTHYSGSLTINGQQVWERNINSNRVNEDSYYKYKGNADVIVLTDFSYDGQGNLTPYPKPAGSGKINNGILSFEAAPLEQENMVDTDALKIFFKEYDAVKIEPQETMGNAIMLVTSDGKYYLNREGVIGLNSSLIMEFILYMYVDRNCRITGSPSEGPAGDYFYRTDSALDISFKKGWNTLCRISNWDKSGYENVSMEIENPNNFKWAIVEF